MPAITPPMASDPPNTFAVFTPTRMFMMAKTALPKIPRIPSRFGYCVAKSPTISGRLRILIIPVIRPEAINAGISGIKTFASCRSASLIGALYLAFACALVLSASSNEAVASPPTISARMASTTCAAFPGPTMSWCCCPCLTYPLTPGSCFRPGRSRSSSLCTSTRTRVMQFSRRWIFFSPPIPCRMPLASAAVFSIHASVSFPMQPVRTRYAHRVWLSPPRRPAHLRSSEWPV